MLSDCSRVQTLSFSTIVVYSYLLQPLVCSSHPEGRWGKSMPTQNTPPPTLACGRLVLSFFCGEFPL